MQVCSQCPALQICRLQPIFWQRQIVTLPAYSFGWWLMAGADLF
jgi:hypothetical protein